MSRWLSYLNSAKTILQQYKGEEPFASFIKKYFAANKKPGSTDRKLISHLCYCYFRVGQAMPDTPFEDRIVTALFVCSREPNQLLEELKPELNAQATLSIEQKIELLEKPGFADNIFPWDEELSNAVAKEEFSLSHLQQPDLFLRLRPGKEETVKLKLAKGGIEFQNLSSSCIALPASSKIDELIAIDKEAVVQDYSSQRVGELLQLAKQESHNRVWDCCAASGGKSIMAKDILGDIDLTVSDVRKSILFNLKKRFQKAGITKYNSLVLDLTKENDHYSTSNNQYSIIIADVPCTGSGTWGRTPEQLLYFEKNKIDEYAVLQKKILENVIPHLLPGGHLLYITCSVFKKENEDAVDFIKEKFHLRLVKMELLKGYDKKADTLFAALFQKPL